jgi:hypothetical protein
VFTDAVKTFQTLSSLLYLMCVTEAKVSNQKGVEQYLYAIYSYKMMNSCKFEQICVNMDLKNTLCYWGACSSIVIVLTNQCTQIQKASLNLYM